MVVVSSCGRGYICFLFTQTKNVVRAFEEEMVGEEMSITEINQRIVTLSNILSTTEPNKKQVVIQEIVELSKIRKQQIKSLVDAGDESIDSLVLSEAIRSSMPEGAKKFVEQKKNITGKFLWTHAHFDEEVTKNEFFVTDSSGKIYKIKYQKNALPVYKTDDTVTLSGYDMDTVFVPEVGQESSPVASTSSTTTSSQSAQTIKKIAVVLFNFQNNTQQPFTPSLAQQKVFTSTDSVAAYFNEASFGKWDIQGKNSVTGDVYGWTTIPYDNTTCSYSAWASAARQQLGVSTIGYDTIVYMFPSTSSCGWSGYGSVGGSPGWSYVNSSNANLNLGTTSHELGHNFGMYHAASYSCYENGVKVPVSLSSNCSVNEYGDLYDLMGSSSYRRHFNVYHKGQTTTNWLNSVNTYTINPGVEPSGVYTLVPQEQSSSSGIQSLRIPRTFSSTGTVTDYYYVELRKPFGFDTFGSTDTAPNGVLIRIAPSYSSAQMSKLIDTVTTTNTVSDSALTTGRTFTDPYTGISITTLSVSATSAEVEVTFNTGGCIPATPLLTLNPTTQSGSPGQALVYQITMQNNDSANCAPSLFSINSNIPQGWQVSPSTFTETIAPGVTINRDLIVSSPSGASSGTSSSIVVQMTGTASSAHSTSRTLVYNVVAPDLASPTLTITKPKATQLPSKGKLSINASATDNVGVTQISIYFDGVLLKTCTNVNSCSTNKQVSQISSGSHTILVNAFDAAGNVSTQTKQVTK